jgi:transposase
VLREVGLKLGTLSRKLLAGQVRELASVDAAIFDIVEPLLAVLDTMARQVEQLTKRVLDAVRVEPICRRLMTVPGVGPLTALAFRATVDQPERVADPAKSALTSVLRSGATSPAKPISRGISGDAATNSRAPHSMRRRTRC